MEATNMKRSRSRSKSSRAPGPKKAKTKENAEVEPVLYEVDYIDGKRPDRKNKGKFEYKVYWKGYPADEPTWEPEQGLQLCREAILAYEQNQGHPVPPKEEEEEEDEDWQKKNEKKLISIGKGTKAAGTSKTLAKVLMTKPKKLLATGPTPKQERKMPKRGASHRQNTISANKQREEKRMPSPNLEAQKRTVIVHFLVQLIEDRQVEEAIRMLELNWGDLFTGQHPMLHIRMLKLGFLDALKAANNNNNNDGPEDQQQKQKLAVDQQAALNMRKAVALGREAKRQLDSLAANSTRPDSRKHRQTIGELQRSLQQIWVEDWEQEQENGLIDDRKQIAAELSQIIGQTQMLAFE